MSRPDHLVYMGSDPESILDLVRSDAVSGDVAVSVVQSTAAAMDLLRTSGTGCLVIDDAVADPDLDSVVERIAAETPGTDVVVRVTGDEEPTLDTSLDVGLVWADREPATRWQQIVTRSDSTSAAEEVTPSRGELATTADGHVDSLANASTVVDTLLDSIVDLFFVFDLDLNLRLWNDSLTEVTGYTDSEIASMGPLEFVGADQRDRALDVIEEIVETGQASAEFPIRTRDGREIPFSFTGSLIQDDDAGTYISGVGRDISDRKARELELRRERDLTNRVIETTPMALVVLDGDGDVLRVNSRATNVLGLSGSGSATFTPDDWQLYDENGDEVATADHPVVQALRTGETVYGHEHRVEMPDGDEKWLSMNTAPITDGSGAVSKVIVAIEDITELKRRERELARRKTDLDEAVAELRRSNAELERFAYVASHDLKEPLRMVSNYLGLLERRYRDELDEDARDFIDYATDGAERMRGLIDGLLKYSRVQRHDAPLEPVDTAGVVDTVRTNLRIAIEETDAEVTTDQLPTVLGDRNHLVQLFQNLLSNAISYCDEDTPRIEISVEQRDDAYQFAVADNGPGIDADEIERVFEIFYSGEVSDSTGVGLAICEKIVQNHGGRIWAESDVGEGTTVYVTLPTESAEPSQFESSLTATDE